MSKSKGLGDSIEKLIEFTGLDKLVKKDDGEECSPCQRRKTALNKIFPYKNTPDPLFPNSDELTTGMYIFMKNSTIIIDGENVPYELGKKIYISEDNGNFDIFKHLYKLGVLKHTT